MSLHNVCVSAPPLSVCMRVAPHTFACTYSTKTVHVDSICIFPSIGHGDKCHRCIGCNATSPSFKVWCFSARSFAWPLGLASTKTNLALAALEVLRGRETECCGKDTFNPQEMHTEGEEKATSYSKNIASPKTLLRSFCSGIKKKAKTQSATYQQRPGKLKLG